MQYKIERANTTIPRLYRVMLGLVSQTNAMTAKECKRWIRVQEGKESSMSNRYKSGGFINNALLKE